MDFVIKGKKRLNSIQLTPAETKKVNNREITTTWERTITMVTELLHEIICSEFPLIISPIFAHLESKKSGRPANKKRKVEKKKITKPLAKKHSKNKKLGFKCGICTKEFPTARTLNNHCSSVHPKQNLICNVPTCTFKTKLEQELQDHTKEKHERSICKLCATITIGTAHKLHHENTIHGKEINPPVKNNKPWVQLKKNLNK